MTLDKVVIGARIRRIRENVFEESRSDFGKRCGLTERHIGQIERGDFLISLSALSSIALRTGIDIEYILFGKGDNNRISIKDALFNIIETSNKDELKMYYKCITAIKSYLLKK